MSGAPHMLWCGAPCLVHHTCTSKGMVWQGWWCMLWQLVAAAVVLHFSGLVVHGMRAYYMLAYHAPPYMSLHMAAYYMLVLPAMPPTYHLASNAVTGM